jgi:ABC-type nickel/cobalt efflux system permease component RcnA
MTRQLVAAALAGVALLAGAQPATAHPLGNATISRAVALVATPQAVRITYAIDMAEIPAFAAILEMETDGDGATSPLERGAWASDRCRDVAEALTVMIEGEPAPLAATGDPTVSFPPGVGGLETLRVECGFAVEAETRATEWEVAVADATDDGRPGWREITIAAGPGATLTASSAPSVSPSEFLRAYPDDLLDRPIDVRAASATVRVGQTAAAVPPVAQPRPASPSPTPGDALAELLGATTNPVAWVVAAAVAAALGAAHALSPGHGKALIAAYAIGSRGSLRRALGLGLTVAVTHTAGVFVLGAVVLSASQLFVPERVVAWLSVVSGILVVIVGTSVARRALRARSAVDGDHPDADHGVHGDGHAHPHEHPHAHPHGHPHPHPQPVSAHDSSLREVLTLGLVGGMVPSTSALLVLLVALTTGRLLEGLALIVAFGAGMAVVLAGLAAIVVIARGRLAANAEARDGSRLGRLVGALPLASALLIMVAGTVATLGAIGSL